jgi:hypothetical protein
MSGHDETFLPPEEGEAKLPPYPPTPAPPHFGQSSAEKPAVVFQTTDTQPGFPVFSGPSAASDAEETMTPQPPKRSGAPTPDAQPTPPQPAGDATPRNGEGTPGTSRDFPTPPVANGTPPTGPVSERTSTGRHAAPPPQWTPPPPPYGTPDSELPEAERTVANGTGPHDENPGFPPYGAAGQNPYDRTTPAPPLYGDPATEVPEAERTATDDPSPRDETPGSGLLGNDVGNDASSPTSVPPPGMPTPDAEGQTVTFEDAHGQRTLAIARFGVGTSSSAPGPALTPDAILPPGTPPQAPPEPPPPDPSATSTGPIPRLGAGPGFPGGPGRTPPRGGDHGGSSGARRALLVGGGLLAALVLGGGGALAVTELSGGSSRDHGVAQQAPPTQALPTPTPSKTKPKHKPKQVPVDIRDEKQDPRPLTIGEVFPSTHITLAGNTFVRVKTVINDHCSLAANGPFATELNREHCRRVVRATFVSNDKKLAVTTGVAVMPTDAAAREAVKVQDPSHYKWFRGMRATGAPKIDQAGGFAASTLRGRYICYAYATYADGHKPAAKDDTLKKVGSAFRDSTARPIERRAQH